MKDIINIMTNRKPTTFISPEEFYSLIQATPHQQQVINKYDISIEEKGVSWILVLTNKIKEELAHVKHGDIDNCRHLSDLLAKILVFVLEDSDYLDSIGESQETRTNLEQQLREVYWNLEAITLIDTNQDIQYITEIIRKLLTSGHLFDRDRKISVLTTLVLFSSNIINLSIDEYIKLVALLDKYLQRDAINNLIQERLRKERDYLDDTLRYSKILDEKIMQKGASVIRLLGAQLLLNKTELITTEQITTHAAFYRYIYALSGYKHDIIRNKAQDSLIHQYSGIEFTWKEILDFDLAELVKKIISSVSATETLDSKKKNFQGHGEIILHDGVLEIYPNFTPKYLVSDIGSFLKDDIILFSSSREVDLHAEDIETLSTSWRTLIDEYSNRPKEKIIIKKERPVVGNEVKIQIKTLGPNNPLFAFVRIVDERFEGEGILHVKGITRVILRTLEGIINPGDIMTAEVVESSPDRLSFSIIEQLDASVGGRFHKDELTNAKLLAKRDDLLTWVSEEGYSLYTSPTPKPDPQVGDCYILKLTDVNFNGYIKAKIQEQVDHDFDIHDAVADLLYHYIDIDGNEANDYMMAEANEPSFPLAPSIIQELELLLDTYTRQDSATIDKINDLYLCKLFNLITGNKRAIKFYTIQINYYLTLFQFAKGFKLDVENWLTDETVNSYPLLQNAKETLSILNLFNKNEHDQDLLSIINSSANPDNVKLARLVLTNNLVNSLKPEISALVKPEILSLLSFHEKKEKETNEPKISSSVYFGKEGDNREFKTSIVFSNKTGSANPESQLETIFRAVAGFLNGEGGTIYIGVADDGIPVGLEDDFNYLHGDEDKYQLILRQYAVENLSKDINGLLTIVFKKFKQKTICAISVPSYHQVVSFKGTVYQRQGNATRPLRGKDLKLLKLRKQQHSLSAKATYPLFPDSPGYFTLPDPQVNVRDKKNLIATSRMQFSQPSANGYYSILENGKYLLTREKPTREDTRISLPIPDDLENNTLLLFYDNGHLNRVTISNLASKKYDFEYQNALYPDANILLICFSTNSDFLYLNCELKKEEYIKIMPIDKIKINNDFSLKGISLLPKFDNLIRIDILKSEQAKHLRIIDNNKNSLGTPVTSLEVIQDRLYLNSLFK